MKDDLIPVQGYPGDQEQRECDECDDGVMEIKEKIWENPKEIRVSMKCQECGEITVKTRERRMFRRRFTVGK